MCKRSETHEDILERAGRALRRMPVSQEPPAEALAKVLSAVERTAAEVPSCHGSRIIRLQERINSMKSKLPFAIAAALVAVVVGLYAAFPGSGRGSAAFAEVIRPLLTARSMTFTLTRQVDGGPAEVAEVMFAEPGRTRLNLADGQVVIADTSKAKVMKIVPATKQATVIDTSAPGQTPAVDRFNVLAGLRQLLSLALDAKDPNVRALGSGNVASTPAVGYAVSVGDESIVIWADSATKTPIQVERATTTAGRRVTEKLTNVRFDVAADESLFVLAAPAGFQVTAIESGQNTPGLVATGTVTDARSGQPIAGAEVTDDGYGPKPYRGAITDPQGGYRYNTWPEEHRVAAKAPGYKTQTKVLKAEDNATQATLNFSLSRQ